MCNEYQLILPVDEVIETFNRTGDRLVFPGGMPNFGPMASIRIGDRAPIITRGPDGSQLIVSPWAWKSPQGRSVFNVRSDGRSFDGVTRCLIPADGFFEFTDAEPGQKRKTKWRFTMADAAIFWVAGLVRDSAFTMLTRDAVRSSKAESDFEEAEKAMLKWVIEPFLLKKRLSKRPMRNDPGFGHGGVPGSHRSGGPLALRGGERRSR